MALDATPSLTLDLKGLNCPLPALRTAKALRRMAPGAMLAVECTDPMAAIDVPHSAFENGGALESRSEDQGVLRFLIRRTAP
jgi:tRNA 2-thiouridine synthesizing protein A